MIWFQLKLLAGRHSRTGWAFMQRNVGPGSNPSRRHFDEDNNGRYISGGMYAVLNDRAGGASWL